MTEWMEPVAVWVVMAAGLLCLAAVAIRALWFVLTLALRWARVFGDLMLLTEHRDEFRRWLASHGSKYGRRTPR